MANFNRGAAYNGFQQALSGNYNFKKYRLVYVGSLLNTTTSFENGTFYKQNFNISKGFKWIETGFNFNEENNVTANKITDSLNAQSFSFKAYEFYLKSVDSAKKEFLLLYNQRFDELPNGEHLRSFSKANTFTGKLVLSKNANSTLAINASYRSIAYLNTDTINKKRRNFISQN